MAELEPKGNDAISELGMASSRPISVPTQPSTTAEEEHGPGGAWAAEQDPAPAEKKAPAEPFRKPLGVTSVGKRKVNTPATSRKRSSKSPNPRKRSSRSPNPKKTPLQCSPERLSPWKCPRKDEGQSSFTLSPRQLLPSPQVKRRSWRRSSLKGSKGRKSLPPLHQDITDLSKSISLELPETDRLSLLLSSSFQFCAQKLEHILQQSDGFSPEAFKAHVHSVSQELQQHLQKLKQDGTLKSCVEDLKGVVLDSALEASVAQVKEYITKFTSECQAWDQLLQSYQESAEERSRQLEECRKSRGQAEAGDYLQTSQQEILSSKPNYQKVLDEQGEVLSCMELVLNELQQAVKLLQAFSEDSRLFLQRLSEQLASRTFRQLEQSPVRKLLSAPRRKQEEEKQQQPPPPES